jgi:hypothetical protein
MKESVMSLLHGATSRWRVPAGVLLLTTWIYTGWLWPAVGAETNAPAQQIKSVPPARITPQESLPAKKTKRAITGAELYALHCNRCHPERYANEWSSAQWKTILTHMRVRANLPAAQARDILKFLQENSGN